MGKLIKIAKICLIIVLLIIPVFTASAQLNNTMPCPPGLNCSIGGSTGIASINSLVYTVISWLLGLAFSLAVLFLIIGGFMYITSGGNEETAEKAKSTIINAIIGIIIIILSYVIISVIVNTISGAAVGP